MAAEELTGGRPKMLKTIPKTIKIFGLTATLLGASVLPAHAAPFFVSATATVQSTSGSYADLTAGTQIAVDISLNTCESAASSANTTPSVVPRHEFTSFYEFVTPTYSWAGDLIPATGGGFNADIMGIVVNDNLPLSSADTGGILPDGTYDWTELLGSKAIDVYLVPGGVCAPDEISPADREEWTLAIFGDSDWFTDGSVIPEELAASFISLIVGIEVDEISNEIGFSFATIDTFSSDLPQAQVPALLAPASAGLAGLFLIAAAQIRSRR